MTTLLLMSPVQFKIFLTPFLGPKGTRWESLHYNTVFPAVQLIDEADAYYRQENVYEHHLLR